MFSPPDIGDAEINEVIDALKSGWITTGPKTKKLEKLLAEFVGTNKLACLNSQTACGEMALRLLGIGKGDEVITCAYTYTASASVIEHVGAKIVMVDCQKDCLEMDYDALEKAITEKTKAVIPVDVAGIPCNYKRIFEIVENKKSLFKAEANTEFGQKMQESLGRIAVICDAAHALGAYAVLDGEKKMVGEIADFTNYSFHAGQKMQESLGRIAVICDAAHALGAYAVLDGEKKMVGEIADFTNYSFHAVKNFTTAEGGAITWKSIPGVDDEDIYHQIQLYSLHGQSKDALAKTQLGAWEYDIKGPWYKCNMTDIMAAIGLGQLSRYPEMLKRRKEIIKKYDEAFRPLGIEVLPHYTEEKVSSGHLYITRIPGYPEMLKRRKEIIKKYDEAFRPLGIEVLPHYTEEKVSSGHLYITRIPGITTEQRNEIIIKMAERGVACNVHYKPLPMMTAYKNLGFDIKDYPNAYITTEQRNEIIIKMAERGVACNVHYKPLPMMTAYKNLGFDIKDYPNAYERFLNEVTLPLHTCLTDEDVEYVINSYKEVLKEYE